MGLKSSPEIYQRAMEDIFGDMEGVEIIMDDLLIHAVNMAIFIRRLAAVLQRCRENNLTLNIEKTRVGLRQVDWVGHVISEEGVKISQKKVAAIISMPTPRDIDQVHRLLALRLLLKREVAFHWEDAQQKSFDDCKQCLTEAPVLRYYNTKEPVVLSCDASSKGLGAVLFQGGRPVCYASKALTEIYQRYAQIEKEAIAIVFACTCFHMMTYGHGDITVETDHKPLETIWKKPICKAPMRLQITAI